MLDKRAIQNMELLTMMRKVASSIESSAERWATKDEGEIDFRFKVKVPRKAFDAVYEKFLKGIDTGDMKPLGEVKVEDPWLVGRKSKVMLEVPKKKNCGGNCGEC